MRGFPDTVGGITEVERKLGQVAAKLREFVKDPDMNTVTEIELTLAVARDELARCLKTAR